MVTDLADGVTDLADGVYDVTCADTQYGRIRAYVVDGDEPILFDCGVPDGVDALLAGIDETGVTPEHLVVTHADFDHAGGFDAVVDAYDLTTHVPEGADLDAGAAADVVYNEGHEVGSFVAVHTPGHRAHQHSWVSEDRGVAVMGDAASGSDQRGLPAGWFHLPPGWFSEDLVLAEESLATLLDYEFDVGLVYHGSSVTEAAGEKLEAYVGRLREE